MRITHTVIVDVAMLPAIVPAGDHSAASPSAKVRSFAWSSDGHWLATSGAEAVIAFDLETGKTRWTTATGSPFSESRGSGPRSVPAGPVGGSGLGGRDVLLGGEKAATVPLMIRKGCHKVSVCPPPEM